MGQQIIYFSLLFLGDLVPELIMLLNNFLQGMKINLLLFLLSLVTWW